MALISVGKARARLGVSAQSVRRFINSGQLIAGKSDTGRWMVDEETLEDLIVSRKRQHSKVPIATPKATQVAKKDNIGVTKPIHQGNIELAGARLAKEIAFLHGARPTWDNLYRTLLSSEMNLDGYTFDCCYKTPLGKIESFHSLPVYALPDDISLFLDEMYIDWERYDLDLHLARNYIENQFRWWVQLLYRDKVIIRSQDESTSLAGLLNWLDRLAEGERKTLDWLRIKRERQDQDAKQDAKIAIGVAGGLLALAALASR